MSTNWPLVPLGQIFEIARGGSPRPIDAYLTDDPNGVNWVLIGDATESGKYINSTKKRIRSEGARRSRAVKPGDFLLTNSMSFGRPYIMNTHGCVHDGWLVLSPLNKNVSPDFFYHLLGSRFVYEEFARRAAGATVKNLNIDLVKTIPAPLPPVAEQRRIAAILDRSNEIKARRLRSLALLTRLQTSLFTKFFGNPGLNEKGWQRQTLSDVCEKITDGTHNSPPIVNGGIAYVTAKHVSTDRIDFFSDPWFISEEDHKGIYSRCDPRQGDVLYVKDGATTGAAAINSYPFEFSMLSSLALLRPNLARCRPEYLCGWLNHPAAKKQILRELAGAAIRRLTIEKLKRAPILCPPIERQLAFEKEIQRLRRLRAAQEESLGNLQRLATSLQHRAFRGEL